MIASLDLHDFSVVNSRFRALFDLKERFPTFKVSMFTVPQDTFSDWGIYLNRKELLEVLKRNLDWIQIIPHGLNHNGSEFKRMDYHTFKNEIIPKIKQSFDKDGLPFVNGFCAPHWRWTEGVVRALDDLNWWGAIDRRQPNMLSPKRFYQYSHCLDEFYDGEILKLHGHVYGTGNDLGKAMYKLLQLPVDTEWHFITDFIEEK